MFNTTELGVSLFMLFLGQRWCEVMGYRQGQLQKNSYGNISVTIIQDILKK